MTAADRRPHRRGTPHRVNATWPSFTGRMVMRCDCGAYWSPSGWDRCGEPRDTVRKWRRRQREEEAARA